MRPGLKLLSGELRDRIVSEARDLLCRLGVEIHNDEVLSLLSDHGAEVNLDSKRALFTQSLLDKGLSTVPRGFHLYNSVGEETHDLSGDNVHFTPGSAAINILDGKTGEVRRPHTGDYVRYVKIVDQLPEIDAQSTAFIPADVPEMISDSYRLYLSLLHGDKPVVTGAFSIDAFDVMKRLQVAVRGDDQRLADKPLTVFSCCPTSPLKWSDVTSQNLLDCARSSIPVELISMPLSGFVAPVTLVGSIIQHTAETLSGLVIGQLAQPGSPILYGGSPAVFDIRYETTPMGAMETMMIDCANSEVGKSLGVPTQAYIALSDAKQLDAQAGLETSLGAVLAALSGINSVSGPGMLDFENCQSLEKLVVDHEICGLVRRLLRGIEPKDDFPAFPLFEELLREKHLLIADHTRKHLKEEIHFPGPVIERANRSRWMEEGGLSLRQRAVREVARLEESSTPSRLDDSTRAELTAIMTREAKRFGMDSLPEQSH